MSKRKIEAIERRVSFLRLRVAAGDSDGRDLSFDKQELGALQWALLSLEKDRRDAERYRWLRDCADPDAGMPCVMIHKVNDWGNWRWKVVAQDGMDAAIDAAMGTASTVASNKSQVLNPLRDDFSQVEYDQKLRGD